MKKTKHLILLLTSLLLLLAACNPSPEPSQEYLRPLNIFIPTKTFQGQPHIDVVRNVTTGDTFTVSLEIPIQKSTEETIVPKESFNIWPEIAETSNENILKQTDHNWIIPGVSFPPQDLLTIQTWTFEALKKGTATISIHNLPTESREKAEWTVTITINIR